MQRRHEKRGLKVVGIASLDKLENVEKYVENLGDGMAYTVAYDEGDKLWNSWMKAAGERGIPNSFIVDRHGYVVWIGHPAGIEYVIDDILNGTFDPKVYAQVIDHYDEMRAAVEEKAASAARHSTDAILKLRPHKASSWSSRVYVESVFGDAAAVRSAVTEGVARLRAHPDELAAFADACVVKRDDAREQADLLLQALAAAAATADDGTADDGTAARRDASTEPGLVYCCALAKLGETVAAVQACERHLARIHDDDLALHRMAEALGNLKNDRACTALAIRAIGRAIELRAGEADYHRLRFDLLVSTKRDIAAAEQAGRAYLEAIGTHKSHLNSLAWRLLTAENLKGRFNALALAAAMRIGAEESENQNYIDTLALAKFENGFVDEAIRLQTRAVKLCSSDASRKEFTERLERFKAARRRR